MSAIKQAAEMLRRDAESMKECHTVGVGGEWYGESAKTEYEKMIAAADAAIAERDALRAKVEAMEKQAPFDADSDVFRSAFEAALKAGNWPATRQGDGYRSPSTQIAWRIAFSTVNRLKLRPAPDAQAQPAPSVPADTFEIIRGLVREIERNTCAHEETHRCGFLWEICDSCGAKWADDEGGKPEFKWPKVVERAYAMLAAAPEAWQERSAQPAPSVPDVPAKSLKPVIDWLRNGCDPQEAAKELELLIGAALKPEAKP